MRGITGFRSKLPLPKVIKGGFEVKIGGTVRAFCPFSLMGIRRDEQAADYIGRSMTFVIAEYAENGRNIILSLKPILDEESRRKEELKLF